MIVEKGKPEYYQWLQEERWEEEYHEREYAKREGL